MNCPSVKLLYIGSSHFSNHRHFKPLVDDLRQGNAIKDVTISALPGGSLDTHVINMAYNYVKNSSTYQVLIILMMACNAIRKKPNSHTMEEMHNKLFSTLKEFTNVTYLLCGCIPSPRGINFNISAYHNFDKFLFETAKESPGQVYFFDTANLFYGKQGLKTFMFNRDGIHLNKEGAHILVMTLHFFINHTVIAQWYPSYTPYPRSLMLEVACVQAQDH